MSYGNELKFIKCIHAITFWEARVGDGDARVKITTHAGFKKKLNIQLTHDKALFFRALITQQMLKDSESALNWHV